jgi:putative SOS response-associated peptidase YedK
MCGRATLTLPADRLRQELELLELPELTPRYNIAPTQPLAIIKTPGKMELASWSSMVNARVEAATTKPAFRCLIAFDGFYEWKKLGPKTKQPYLFRRVDRGAFLVGGVLRSDGSAAVVTTAAQADMEAIHDRQPVVLQRSEWAPWLAGQRLVGSLGGMVHFPVSQHVSNWRNDDAECLVPLE